MVPCSVGTEFCLVRPPRQASCAPVRGSPRKRLLGVRLRILTSTSQVEDPLLPTSHQKAPDIFSRMKGTPLLRRTLQDYSAQCPTALQCPRQTPLASPEQLVPSNSTSAMVYKWHIPQGFMGRKLSPRHADVGADGTCKRLGPGGRCVGPWGACPPKGRDCWSSTASSPNSVLPYSPELALTSFPISRRVHRIPVPMLPSDSRFPPVPH